MKSEDSMAEAKNPVETKKIADVAQPGESAPSPNSKSVIISHHPAMADPMVNADVKADVPATQPASRVVIKPLATSELVAPAPTVDAVKDESSAPTQPVSETPPETTPSPAPVPIADVTPKPVTPNEAPTPTSVGSDATVGTKSIQSGAEIAIAEDAESKHQAELAALVENKTYYLSIVTTESQRTKQFVIAGIVMSLLLAALWTDVALDAGLVHIKGIHSLTHFFN